MNLSIYVKDECLMYSDLANKVNREALIIYNPPKTVVVIFAM